MAVAAHMDTRWLWLLGPTLGVTIAVLLCAAVDQCWQMMVRHCRQRDLLKADNMKQPLRI